jgi:hypothetical protein
VDNLAVAHSPNKEWLISKIYGWEIIFKRRFEYLWRSIFIYDSGVLVRALPGVGSQFGMTVPRNFELAHLPALDVPTVYTPMVPYETCYP